MTAGGANAARRLRPLLLVLAIVAVSAPAPAGSPLPLKLVDVRTGQSMELGPGPTLLHVVLFASWCPPCVAELDRLADMEARWGGSGYRLVLVAVENRHTRERLLKFTDQRRPPGTLLFDEAGQAQQSFGVKTLPAHIVMDATGNEIVRSEMLDDDLERTIASVFDPDRGEP